MLLPSIYLSPYLLFYCPFTSTFKDRFQSCAWSKHIDIILISNIYNVFIKGLNYTVVDILDCISISFSLFAHQHRDTGTSGWEVPNRTKRTYRISLLDTIYHFYELNLSRGTEKMFWLSHRKIYRKFIKFPGHFKLFNMWCHKLKCVIQAAASNLI